MAETHLRLAINDRLGVVVTLHGPNPIVWTVLKIADSTVSITHGPTGDEHLLEVGNIVTVGILEVDCGLAVLNDDSAAIADQGRGNAQVFSVDGELISLTIVVGVFTNLDAVTTLALRLKLIGIVDRFANP